MGDRNEKESCRDYQQQQQQQQRSQLDSIVDAAGCIIVVEVFSNKFDSYIVSESSLVIYSQKIVLKTCGKTMLLLAIGRIVELAHVLCLTVFPVRYSRGSFIFPEAQLAPRRNFSEEVAVLDSYFGGLKTGSNTYILGDPANRNFNWHVYCVSQDMFSPLEKISSITVEVCMTHLEKGRASRQLCPHMKFSSLITISAGTP
ncbi:hypothetical protein GIB67_036604 [Kingdonia uniflora]|uniref:Adenosylmethionine decarboxylase n=1 Tax=Kingdonia uniflora TaxID=39325 RepID=A0A7J7M0I8_9MAGN|nr:hypothetical protein GIB67_036604 [Kingdonia uniflora]